MLTATSDQCLGRECPQYTDCFVTRMRERAAEADLVIVNHHLLCADASVRKGGFGEVIPECELAVIDEAHQLEDVVTQYFGVALGTHRVDELDARCGARAGRVAADAHGAGGPCGRSAGGRAADRTRAVRHASGSKSARPAARADRATLTAALAERLSDAAARASRSPRSARRPCIQAVPDATDDLQALRRCAAIAASDDVAVLLAADDPRFVHFVEIARPQRVLLRAAPIDVSRHRARLA